MNDEVKVGDRVRRVGFDSRGERGTVVEIAERAGRACASQTQIVEVRIRVQWDPDRYGPGKRTWLAMSARGKRWDLESKGGEP